MNSFPNDFSIISNIPFLITIINYILPTTTFLITTIQKQQQI
nr:MAG TPA: hypothetical protein [Crassvirales sp.]